MRLNVAEVIWTEHTVGLGKEDDPIRPVYTLWTKNGDIIASLDHFKGTQIVNGTVCELGPD